MRARQVRLGEGEGGSVMNTCACENAPAFASYCSCFLIMEPLKDSLHAIERCFLKHEKSFDSCILCNS